MLPITIPGGEGFNERTGEFVYWKTTKLSLEHSLVSVSKWESRWHKSFFSKEDRTTEETIDYVRCMTLTQNVDPAVYYHLTAENYREINDYISDPMTATTFRKESTKKFKKPNEKVTSELIYYWMIALGIPSEYQKWHLNRLTTLIQVCSVKNTPAKKTSLSERYQHNRALNAARKKQWHTRG